MSNSPDKRTYSNNDTIVVAFSDDELNAIPQDERSSTKDCTPNHAHA